MQIFIFFNMYVKSLRFRATYNVCEMVNAYYLKINQEPKVRLNCILMYAIYAVWTVVDLVLISLRITSLVYMMKSFKFLQRKAEDKERRKMHIAKKRQKIKRQQKRDLHKKILEKKSEQILYQQKINRQAQEEIARREFMQSQAERNSIYGGAGQTQGTPGTVMM